MEKRNLVLSSVLIGTLMSAIDTTIVILALPTITDELHSTLFLSIWIIIIYLLVVAVFTTQLGRLGDLFGRKNIFNFGFVVFITGSALCGFATDMDMLIASRGLQAFGASLMQSNSNAIVADNFGAHERGRAFGYTTMGWNVGGTLGIVLGGFITTFIGWRYIFFINVPIGLAGLALGMKYIRDTERKSTGLDIGGMALLGILLVLITYGATDIAGSGLDLFNLSLIVVGLLMLIPFIIMERRAKSPIMNLQAFRVRILSYSLIASFTQALGYLSVVFLLIMYLQGIRGYSPLKASLILVPGYVIASLLAPGMGRFSDRFGPHIVASAGIVMMAVAVIVYTTLTAATDVFLVIIPASLVSGVGGAMFWPANNSAVMSSSPKNIYGSVSGLLRTLSSIGTLFSYVLSISIASVSVPRYIAFEVFLGTSTLRGGISGTFLQGIHTAFFASFALLILAGIFSFFRGTHGSVKAVPAAQPAVDGANK